MRYPLVVGGSFTVFLLLEEAFLLDLLLNQVIELLFVEVLIYLVLVVQLFLPDGRSSAGLSSSALWEEYWKSYCCWSRESWATLIIK